MQPETEGPVHSVQFSCLSFLQNKTNSLSKNPASCLRSGKKKTVFCHFLCPSICLFTNCCHIVSKIIMNAVETIRNNSMPTLLQTSHLSSGAVGQVEPAGSSAVDQEEPGPSAACCCPAGSPSAPQACNTNPVSPYLVLRGRHHLHDIITCSSGARWCEAGMRSTPRRCH